MRCFLIYFFVVCFSNSTRGQEVAQPLQLPLQIQLPEAKRSVPSIISDRSASVTSRELEASMQKGIDFLLQSQLPNGSWGSPTKTKGLNIYAPVPGAHHAFRMGATTLALAGLIDSRNTRPEVLVSIDRCEKWLVKELPKLKKADVFTCYNIWGHAYALHALVALAQRDGVSEEQHKVYQELAQLQFDELHRNQDVDGGWGYYQNFASSRPAGKSMCFTTGTVLVAMNKAEKEFGLTYAAIRKKQAIDSVIYQRTADFSYVYSRGHKYRPRYRINRPGGSLARSQVCNLALRLHGDEKVTDLVVTKWLDRLVKRNGWLDIGRKRPVPHETHFAVSGYFYYYGHYYASYCIGLLPEKDQTKWKHQLASIIIHNQDRDGSWWDYPLYDYHQAYGTGYALSTLSRCR